ncbi:MAG: ABC transporter permease [Candidatus Gottesmanbacteria bacterium]|nr:ABC transporter permease [Candidatus Gottesmanbacteria bacterium]
MNIMRVWAIIVKFWFDTKRDMFRLFDVFWWPAFNLFVWGLLSTYLTQLSKGSVNFVLLFLAGTIFWSFFDRASRDISRSMVEELWSRNLPNLFSTPLTLTEYLAGVLTVAFVKLVIGSIFLLVLSKIFYGFEISLLGWPVIGIMAGLMIFGWSVSFFIQSFVLRYGHTVEVFIWAVTVLLQPFSCVFYPLSALPVWAQWVARAFPSMYLFEQMRAIISGTPVRSGDIMISMALNAVYLILSVIFFYRTFRYAKSNGLLTKPY